MCCGIGRFDRVVSTDVHHPYIAIGSVLVTREVRKAALLHRKTSFGRPVEECGALSAGDDAVGAVAVVSGWVTALGDSSGPEPVNVVFEHRIVIVDEQIPAAIIGLAECPDQAISNRRDPFPAQSPAQ